MKLQEVIKHIADTLKVDVETLTKAFELPSEKLTSEVELEFPKVTTYTEEEYSTLETNLKKSSYNEGKTAGSEMTAKELKKLSGIDVDGKDINSIFEAIVSKAKADAGVKPNEEIAELKKSIQKLQETVTTKEAENASLIEKHAKQSLEYKILGLIPQNSIGLTNSTILNDMRSNGYNVSEVEGKLTVTKNGETLKDQKLQNPLSFEDVATQYLKEKNWLKASKDGRGGGDEGGNGGAMNYEQFVKQCEKDGINLGGAEAQAKARELAKDNPNFYN